MSDWVFIEPLTAREREVMGCLRDGLGVRDMAATLGVSTNTVKYHVRNIYAKLGVDSKASAIVRYGAAQEPACG